MRKSQGHGDTRGEIPAIPPVIDMSPLRVSMVAQGVSTEPKSVLLSTVVEAIRVGHWDNRIGPIRQRFMEVMRETQDISAARKAIMEMKIRLPGILFSGVFSRRDKDSLIEASGLVVLDIDDVPPAVLSGSKAEIKKDPSVIVCGVSPSGAGLKVIYATTSHGTLEEHKMAFEMAKMRLGAMGFDVDGSGKDLARLAFVFSDPEVYFNPDAVPLDIGEASNGAPAPKPEPVPFVEPEGYNYRQRLQIASSLFGPPILEQNGRIWINCPGKALHQSGADAPRDCELHLEKVPNVFCFHHHCESAIAEANKRLQSEIGKAEWIAAHPAHPARTTGAVIRAGIAPAQAALPTSAPAALRISLWPIPQFEAYVEPPDQHLLLPKYITRGAITAIIGQPGVGKSRLAFGLVISHILGRKWCGLTTFGGPARWIYFGNENSIGRIKGDIGKMLAGLSGEELEIVKKHFLIQAVTGYEDSVVNLDFPAVMESFKAHILEQAPDGIIIDPLGNFTDDDLAKPAGMAGALDTITAAVRSTAPRAALILSHHARVGRSNIAQSTGIYDSQGYALGGKALAGRARCVINVIPGSEDESGRVVLECAKANDCELFRARGLLLDEETFKYEVDEDFDMEQWKDDVEGKRSGQACSITDVVKAVQTGSRTKDEIVETVRDLTGCSQATVYRRLKEARELGYLETAGHGMWMIGRKRLNRSQL